MGRAEVEGGGEGLLGGNLLSSWFPLLGVDQIWSCCIPVPTLVSVGLIIVIRLLTAP